MSEEKTIMKTKKSPMVIIGDLLKFPWLIVLMLALYFWYVGSQTDNYNGLYAVLGFYVFLLPVKFLLIRRQSYHLTNARTIHIAGSPSNTNELMLEQIDYVNIEYPVFGKTFDYGHVIITYNYNAKTRYKNVKAPFKYAEALSEAVRYAKAKSITG